MNITILGCGDVGTRCARLLLQAGHTVTGVRRNITRLPPWLPAAQADVLDTSSLGVLCPPDKPAPDVVIYSLAASGFDEQSYIDAYITGVENSLQALRNVPLKRFIFVSSTGVYHQNDGSIVDEDSATEPVRFNGRRVLQGEQLVRARNTGTCVRYSGIYGPKRLRLINRVA
ncbi:MAG: NAD-dependent epimerase/dehydratase family protein, partial [Pseudomonadota bacterium]